MLVILIIISLIVLAAIAISIYFIYDDEDEMQQFLLGMILGVAFIFCIGLWFAYFDNTPMAIDVYRNNTELVINGEMIDSTFIPKDSIVVFK